MTRSIRVAAVQLRAHDRSGFERSLEAILASVEAAAERARLIVLPEGSLPAYVLGDDPIDEAVVDAAIGRLREIARRRGCTIVAGAAVRETPSGLPHNAALVIDCDGRVAGQAHKLFLWHFDRRWFAPGERVAPVETSLGKLGVLVCADGRLPSIARELVDRGAELLVMPTAWVTSGRDPNALENVQADLLARVRAFENGVPFVAANKCGSELGMVAYCGKSQAIDAAGRVVAMAGEREPETIFATLELDATRPHRTTPARPPARAPLAAGALRVAISPDPLPADIDRRLEILGNAHAIAPPLSPQRLAALDAVVPSAVVSDSDVLDPGGLIGYRRAGYVLAVWETGGLGAWTEPLARARALELRIYVVAIDTGSDRAFAIDPDGNAVAGTFGGYRLASFSLDPRKSAETAVAPGTDVAQGLERIAAIVERASEITA
ncbi:MAG TPA: carbon-nitrogen hydrolase family protein [Candidatus Tumulicola sp.]|jgi:predicted amidohydrolase